MSNRSYDWRDIPVGYKINHYEVKFYDDGFLKATERSVSKKPLQKKIQDWMDGHNVKFGENK